MINPWSIGRAPDFFILEKEVLSPIAASAQTIRNLLEVFVNERTSEGWEFVTYDYMATSTQMRGAFIVTFRKEKV